MTSDAPAKPNLVGSFIFTHEQTGTTYLYYESPAGVGCNYCDGDPEQFSLRLHGRRDVLRHLREDEVSLLLETTGAPGTPEEEEDDGATEATAPPQGMPATVTPFPKADMLPLTAAA